MFLIDRHLDLTPVDILLKLAIQIEIVFRSVDGLFALKRTSILTEIVGITSMILPAGCKSDRLRGRTAFFQIIIIIIRPAEAQLIIITNKKCIRIKRKLSISAGTKRSDTFPKVNHPKIRVSLGHDGAITCIHRCRGHFRHPEMLQLIVLAVDGMDLCVRSQIQCFQLIVLAGKEQKRLIPAEIDLLQLISVHVQLTQLREVLNSLKILDPLSGKIQLCDLIDLVLGQLSIRVLVIGLCRDNRTEGCIRKCARIDLHSRFRLRRKRRCQEQCCRDTGCSQSQFPFFPHLLTPPHIFILVQRSNRRSAFHRFDL